MNLTVIKKIRLILGVLFVAVFAAGCSLDDSITTTTPGSYQNDAAKVEQTQQKVQKSVPIPPINNSAERKNISDRAVLFDKENVQTYVYLVSYGKVMAFYTARGKVSSLNSYLTPIDKLVYADGSPCDRNYYTYQGRTWEPCYVVQAPDIDGAYGKNTDGIFFFTTDGAYVEWSGSYMASDYPLSLTTQPELIRNIK